MDGFVIVNKDAGMTSFDVVSKMRKIFKTKKVGHTGTLDPMTTGVLVVGLNKACKLMELSLDKKKVYRAEALIGYSTDTLDITGEKLEEVLDVNITKDQVLKVLEEISKTKSQVPPMYSAIKINGKKLYEYARAGIEVKREPRNINIDYINLISDLNEKDNNVVFSFDVKADGGIYIRSLIEDIGKMLGYPACMSGLIRLSSGTFDISKSNTLDEIKEGIYTFISVEEAFSHYPSIEVNDYIAKLVKNGVELDSRQADFDTPFLVYNNKKLIAIYRPHNDSYKIVVYLGEENESI